MTAAAGRSEHDRPAPDVDAVEPDGAAPGAVVRRVALDALLEELRRPGCDPAEAVVLGGGCAGLALGVALADAGGAVTVVEARQHDRDGRTWCYWDTGDALLPEAVTRSWDRWEIRTVDGTAVAADPAHPYRLVRAHDYRAAARARIARSRAGRLVDGVRVDDGPVDAERSRRLFDARGPVPAGPVPHGRVRLHQRFVGRWVRAARPVFDDTVVTLMDFPRLAPGEDARFHYVLPIAADLALVECTVLSRTAHDALPLRRLIGEYVRERWGLSEAEWTVEGEEAGSIPMTDAHPPTTGRSGAPLGLRAGAARPSTGYAFTRMQIAARRTAAALAAGDAAPIVRDPCRIRVLDAVFLRFLRDQPQRAPAVFLRMFARLPGPLTVRFLTERSSPLDEARLILALPKAPFLVAAAATLLERLRGGSA